MSAPPHPRVMLLAATMITIASWAGTAQAIDYCVYSIISGFPELSQDIGSGDVICVDCPSGTTECPGPGGINFIATIRNAQNTESAGTLRKLDPNCVTCPSQGKTGYSFVMAPRVGLVEDDIGWTTTAGVVRFHLRFQNTADDQSDPAHFDVFLQNHYGAFLSNGSLLWNGDLPPIAPSSFFDVFFDVPMNELPAPPGGILNDPCAPDAAWYGSIDVTWSEPGGGGSVSKHAVELGLTPGGATNYVHVLSGCAGPVTWSFGPACPDFTLTLRNLDFTPAPASLPPGWAGWIGVSAGPAVPGGTTCCFKLDVQCGLDFERIDLCAKACSEPTSVKRKRWAEVKAFYR